ncbi:hypothetical protein [Desulfosoma caldarium]|uniref:Uncharacterized protein n=1 Tax=Desulfosoma caldarium TaxID=610254 RepID=A0A3N1VGK0_9BACT|nr:hypothetical protein [Desulfosoma caldarium]ROR01956.1 hypothetical protein EDC27_1153 [Desulfosoma caldarium]
MKPFGPISSRQQALKTAEFIWSRPQDPLLRSLPLDEVRFLEGGAVEIAGELYPAHRAVRALADHIWEHRRLWRDAAKRAILGDEVIDCGC